MPSEFLLFSADFPDCKFEEKLEGCQLQSGVLSLLESARSVCMRKMFDYAPLEKQGIETLAGSLGAPKTVGEMAGILAALKPGLLEARLKPFVKTPAPAQSTANPVDVKKQKADPVEFAFSYFLYSLWKTAAPGGVTAVQAGGSPQKRVVRFAASTQSWVVVKKVDLDKAEPKETLFALSGILSSANKKIPEFASSAPAEYDSFVSTLLGSFPVRKSFAKLPILLKEAASREAELARFAMPGGRALNALKQCFYLSCFGHAGFTPFVSLDTVAGVYPELKIPKPRGNFGGKKKGKA